MGEYYIIRASVMDALLVGLSEEQQKFLQSKMERIVDRALTVTDGDIRALYDYYVQRLELINPPAFEAVLSQLTDTGFQRPTQGVQSELRLRIQNILLPPTQGNYGRK